MKKSLLSRIAAGFLFVVFLPVLPFTVSAEAETVKNYEYYMNLPDYDVYVEYMEAYVATEVWPISETLPAPEDVPGYKNLNQYTDNATDLCNDFEIALHVEGSDPVNDRVGAHKLYDELCVRLETDPELLGFSEDWSTTAEDGTLHSVVEVEDDGYCIKASDGAYFKVLINYDILEEYAGTAVNEDIFDIMRIILTIRHSDIMQECMIEGTEIEWQTVPLPPLVNPPKPTIAVSENSEATVYGDANCDDLLNVLDIIVVNQNLLQGCEMSAQGVCNADVNLDQIVNAADSLLMLKSIVGVTELPHPVET